MMCSQFLRWAFRAESISRTALAIALLGHRIPVRRALCLIPAQPVALLGHQTHTYLYLDNPSRPVVPMS